MVKQVLHMLEHRLLYDYTIGMPQQSHEMNRVTASQHRLLTLVVSNFLQCRADPALANDASETTNQSTLIIEPQRKVTRERLDTSPSLQAVSTK